MPAHPHLRRVAGGAVAFGLLAVVQVSTPSAADAAGATPSIVRAAYGSPGPINVVVSSDGRSFTISSGNYTGTATIRINGQSFEVQLSSGQGSFTFPAGLALGDYTFTITVGGEVQTKTLYVTPYGNVVGLAAYKALLRANGVGANRGGGVSGSESDGSTSADDSESGTLPATGVGAPTELLGLLGLGLLGAGGASIVIARRRARA